MFHSSFRSICHSSEPQMSSVCISSFRPTSMENRCSEYRLVWCHKICLPSDCSPSQGDKKICQLQLPQNTNSSRLTRNALVMELVQLSTELLLQLPVSATLFKQSPTQVFQNNPQHLNLHAWCLGVNSSKKKPSLWKWQRELLPLKGHQQGPSRSQSGTLFEKWCRENFVELSTPSV